MKYFLILSFVIFFNSCGGSSTNNSFKATLIDGYLVESNISIYDENNKKLSITTLTDQSASFSLTDKKNNIFYITAISGIDTMYDEVFESILYGVIKKGDHNIISPLSSLALAYDKSNTNIDYKTRAKQIQDNLYLEKDILTFDPIANIADKEASKIIKFNVTLETISRLINESFGGNFEYIFYSLAYDRLQKSGNLDLLYSDSFISDLEGRINREYNYLDLATIGLKLRYLKNSIAYIVDEFGYFEADNKEDLEQNYKASYILSYSLIKEASLLQDITIKETTYASEYFNDLHAKIYSLKMEEIIKGIKILGGFRGILYKTSNPTNNLARATKDIKPSFFSNSLLNKDLLLSYSLTYDELSKSISSGAPSQDQFKDEIIRNTIFLNMENQEPINQEIIEQIQNQIYLSYQFVKKDAINPSAEALVKHEEIKRNKDNFNKSIQKVKDDIEKSEVNAISISNIDTETINQNNAEKLSIYKQIIQKKVALQNNNIKEHSELSQLLNTPASQTDKIIQTALNFELVEAKEILLTEEIKSMKLSLRITDYKTQLANINDANTEEKKKLEENIEASENSKESYEDEITKSKAQITTLETSVKFIDDVLNNKDSAPYNALLETSINVQKKLEKDQNLISQVQQARKIYDVKIQDLKNEKISLIRQYEQDLVSLSESIDKNEESLDTINKIKAEITAIEIIEQEEKNIQISKKDLANPIDFSIEGLKSCYNKDDNNLFSIRPDQNNSFITITLSGAPNNTEFDNNILTRKKSDGINPFYMGLGDYNMSINVENTDTEVKKSKNVTFQIKNSCTNNTSMAFKAPLEIPNIPTLKAPELNVSTDLPNPNDDTTPPTIDNKPPEDN